MNDEKKGSQLHSFSDCRRAFTEGREGDVSRTEIPMTKILYYLRETRKVIGLPVFKQKLGEG